MTDPYRAPSTRVGAAPGPRWGATRWAKLYVRWCLPRLHPDWIRDRAEERAYRRRLREHERYILRVRLEIVDLGKAERPPPLPPAPAPPPSRVRE